MSVERRKNRSEVVHEALALYLQAVAERAGVKAIAVANEDGFLIAGAGGGFNHEWLAALGSVSTGEERSGTVGSLIEDVTGGEAFFASSLSIFGRRLYLSSVGARVSEKELTPGLCRILGSSIAPSHLLN